MRLAQPDRRKCLIMKCRKKPEWWKSCGILCTVSIDWSSSDASSASSHLSTSSSRLSVRTSNKARASLCYESMFLRTYMYMYVRIMHVSAFFLCSFLLPVFCCMQLRNRLGIDRFIVLIARRRRRGKAFTGHLSPFLYRMVTKTIGFFLWNVIFLGPMNFYLLYVLLFFLCGCACV